MTRRISSVPIALCAAWAMLGGLLVAVPALAQGAGPSPKTSSVVGPIGSPGHQPGTFVPLPPTRILDTRIRLGAAPARPGATIHLQVTGRGGIPTAAGEVAAVVLNVTVTAPTRAGYITAFPDGTARPTASNLNFTRGRTVANLVTVKVGAHGRVALTNASAGTTQLLADVSGYYLAGATSVRGTYVPLTPRRVLDTRRALGISTALPPRSSAVLAVAGTGGIPSSGAEAIVLNVTATRPTRGGYLTLYPTGSPRPKASTLNFARGRTVAALTTAMTSGAGSISIYNGSSGTVDVVADVAGYYRSGAAWSSDPPAGTFVPMAPRRIIDTRSGSGSPVGPRRIVSAPVTALSPWAAAHTSGVAAVVATVTAVAPTQRGYLTAYPGGGARPTTSTLNFTARQTLANMAVIPVGTDGTIAVSNGSTGSTHVLVDVMGFVVFATRASSDLVAAGLGHSCAVTEAGGVRCWGDNSAGQASGTATDYPTAHVALPDGSSAIAVAAGGQSTCAVIGTGGSGEVRCWGDNSSGQLGDGTTASTGVPVTVPGLPPMAAVAVSSTYACGLAADGGVWCWGSTPGGPGTARSAPAPVPGLAVDIANLSVGYRHACVITQLGAVECWGRNDSGQLGDGSTTASSAPRQVAGLGRGAITVASGTGHSCATTDQGAVWCWGDDVFGALGGTPTAAYTPVLVTGLPASARAVATGTAFSCALLAGGTASCWGNNNSGELGNGTVTTSSSPGPVEGLSTAATAIVAGANHVCVALDDGTVACWGDNTLGEVGNGETTRARTPAAVVGMSSGVTTVSAGLTGCAIQGGSLRCWGFGGTGAIGDGDFADRFAPVPVTGPASTSTSVGTNTHTCAVIDGGVRCWGGNSYGELGNGSTKHSATAVAVTGLGSGMAEVVTGGAFSCALSDGGAVSCWGFGAYGALGNGSTGNSHTPVPVQGLGTGVAHIAAGGGSVCALTDVGSVLCWGYDAQGQLGDGPHPDGAHGASPIEVTALPAAATAVAVGDSHACAVTSPGAVWCWGLNTSGQLGTGTTDGPLGPTAVTGATSGATSVAVGRDFSCAVVSSALMCWGANGLGQLGIGTTQSRSLVPRAVPALAAGVQAVSAGGTDACAIADGALLCWGNRAHGAIGDGSSTAVPTARVVVGF